MDMVIYNTSSSNSVGCRMRGSTDSHLFSFRNECSTAICGLDSSKIFQLSATGGSTSDVAIYLRGYTTTGVTLTTNATQQTISTANTWVNLGILPSNAIAGIYHVAGNGQPVGVRPGGAFASRTGAAYDTMATCGAFGRYVEGFSASYNNTRHRYQGYITDGYNFTSEGVDVTPPYSPNYQPLPPLPPNAVGAIYEVTRNGMFGLRAGGSTDDPYVWTFGHTWYIAACDDYGIVEAKLATCMIYLLGYLVGGPRTITTTPQPTAITLATLPPIVTATDDVSVIPQTTALTIVGGTPDVRVDRPGDVFPVTSSIALTTYSPDVAATGNYLAKPQKAALTIRPRPPLIWSGEKDIPAQSPYQVEIWEPPRGGWVSPYSATATGPDWKDLDLAFDQSILTSAYWLNGLDVTYGYGAEIIFYPQTSYMDCDAIKVSILVHKEGNPADGVGNGMMRVRAYTDSSYVTVYQGSIDCYRWVDIPFGQNITISSVRISFLPVNSPGLLDYWECHICEMRFHEASAPGSLVAVLDQAYDVKAELDSTGGERFSFSVPGDDSKLSYLANRGYDIRVKRLTPSGYAYLTSGVMDHREDEHGDGLRTTIEVSGYISQLADSWVDSYKTQTESFAPDWVIVQQIIGKTIDELLLYQFQPRAIERGIVDEASTRPDYFIRAEDRSVLQAILDLQDGIGGGYLSVDVNRKLNWRGVNPYNGRQLRYRKNLAGVSRTISYADMGNRIYAYGGIIMASPYNGRRILLSDFPGQSLPYIEDKTSIDAYGVVVRRILDDNARWPEALWLWANAELRRRKEPVVSYKVSLVDLSPLPGYEWNNLSFGETYRVIDEELGITTDITLARITYPDLSNPLAVEIELANRRLSITDSLTDIVRGL